MNPSARVYLALGDSMSIDDYTGVVGGGAASRLYRTLPPDWQLLDLTRDGCRMAGVPRYEQGHLITLTIGGNDLLTGQERYFQDGLAGRSRGVSAGET